MSFLRRQESRIKMDPRIREDDRKESDIRKKLFAYY